MFDKNMKTMRNVIIVVVIGVFALAGSYARAAGTAVALPAPGASAPSVPSFSGSEYGTKAPAFENALGRADTYQQKLDVVRSYVKSARYAGEPRLQHMFKNFGPGYRLDLNDPGVLKDLKLLGSKNPQVVKGAARELVFYQKFYNSPHFTNVKIGAPVPTAGGGPSDQDITFTTKMTGRKTWVEVKEVKNLKLDARIKAQIDRMAEARDFHRKVLVNRKGVDPAVKAYAKQKGVEVLDNVRSKDIVREILIVERKVVAKKQIASGGFQAGLGLWLTAAQGWQTYGALTDTRLSQDARWRKAGSHGSLAVTGAAVTAKGVLTIKSGVRPIPPIIKTASSASSSMPTTISPLAKYSKILGPVAWVGLGAYAGFEANRWLAGDINTRQLTHTYTSLGGGVGGALAGAKAGAKVGAAGGSLAGPKGTVVGLVVGGVAGSVGGAFGGSSAAAWAGDATYDHFRMSDDELNGRKLEALRASL